MDNYKGVSLFNDVESPKLRAYNRCSSMFNILKYFGQRDLGLYCNCLTDTDREEAFAMWKRIQDEGLKAIKLEVSEEVANVEA